MVSLLIMLDVHRDSPLCGGVKDSRLSHGSFMEGRQECDVDSMATRIDSQTTMGLWQIGGFGLVEKAGTQPSCGNDM